jgi:hypothetical protein
MQHDGGGDSTLDNGGESPTMRKFEMVTLNEGPKAGAGLEAEAFQAAGNATGLLQRPRSAAITRANFRFLKAPS